MERLTEKIKNKETGEILAYRLSSGRNRIKADQKLGKYEDLEEQGLLLKLDVKPEEKLFWISDPDDEEFNFDPIEEVEVCNIDYNGYCVHLWFADKGEKEFPTLPMSYIGKELFKSYEEAEQALKQIGE